MEEGAGTRGHVTLHRDDARLRTQNTVGHEGRRWGGTAMAGREGGWGAGLRLTSKAGGVYN